MLFQLVPLHDYTPPPAPQAAPLVASAESLMRPTRNEMFTPAFVISHPHIMAPFSFDPQQRKEKYSVQAKLDITRMNEDERPAWRELCRAVKKAKGAGRSPFRRAKPGCDEIVVFNLSCMKMPRIYGVSIEEAVDTELDRRVGRALVDIVTYETRAGTGVVLGLRAIEIIR